MIAKIIIAFMTASIMFSSGVAIDGKCENKHFENETQMVLLSDEVQESYIETSSSNWSVSTTAVDSKEVGVNMVNRNLITGTTGFESFNIYSYNKRSPISATSDNLASLGNNLPNNSEQAIKEEENVQYTEGYTPKIDSARMDFLQNEYGHVSPESIIEIDERTQVTTPKSFPYRATALIEMIYKNVLKNDGKYHTLIYGGTAFMAASNLAITAGHCVYDDVTDDGIDNPRFVDEIVFYFGINGKSEKNNNYIFYAFGVAANIEYSYYVSRDSNHDWAAVELNQSIGNLIGWYGFIRMSSLEGAEIKSHGYPLDKPDATMWETTGTIFLESDYTCFNNLDTASGQSGSAYLMSRDDDEYVCAIHTTGSSYFNCGIKISDLILNYIGSFKRSRNDPTIYDFPSLDVVSKSGNTWTIEITNTSSMGINLEYNSKMCTFYDARDWKNLKDLVPRYLYPYEKTAVTITENWFATSITCSYIYDNNRIISYANRLDANGTLSIYNNRFAV